MVYSYCMRRTKRNNHKIYTISAISVILMIFGSAVFDLTSGRDTSVTADIGYVLLLAAPIVALVVLGTTVLKITTRLASEKLSSKEKSGMLKRLVVFVGSVVLVMLTINILNKIFTKLF